MTALVTGGAGFMGRALVRSLVSRAWKVVSYDINEGPTSAEPFPLVRYVTGSILDSEGLADAMRGVDAIFHFAGISSVPACSEAPSRAVEQNVMGTARVLEAYRSSAPAAVFLFASSAHVYGGSEKVEKFNERDPPAPASMYATSKAAAEAIALQFQRSYDLDVRIARYSNVYGPGQKKNILFDFFRKASLAESEFLIEGSGVQQRDFIFIDDAVAASLDLATRDVGSERIVNVSSGAVTSVSFLAQLVCDLIGRGSLTIRTTKESWLGDIDILACDNSLLMQLAPQVFTDISTGTRAYVDWLKTSGLSDSLYR